MNATTTRRSEGFTLLEVLITVVIIVLLASLLMPVLAETRMAARGAACTSNLKQLGVALEYYRTKWGCFPPHQLNFPGGTCTRWMDHLADLTDLEGKALQCPATPLWVAGRNYSYGYNYRTLGSTRRLADGSFECFPVRQVARSAKTIAFGDSSGTGTREPYEEIPPGRRNSSLSFADRRPRVGNHAFTLDPTYLPRRIRDGHTGDLYSDRDAPSFAAPRHGGKANFCMVDGHVEGLTPVQLYEDNRWWNGTGREDPRDDHVADKLPGLADRYGW